MLKYKGKSYEGKIPGVANYKRERLGESACY